MILNSLNGTVVHEVKVSNADIGNSIEMRLMKIEVFKNKVKFTRLSSGESFEYNITDKVKTFYVCNAWVTDNYMDIVTYERNNKIVVFSMFGISLLLICVGIFFGANK